MRASRGQSQPLSESAIPTVNCDFFFEEVEQLRGKTPEEPKAIGMGTFEACKACSCIEDG